MANAELMSPVLPAMFRPRLKDRYWMKTLKWYLYKRRTGHATWRTAYLFDRYARSLTPHDVVIDCGANVGLYSRRLAANGSTVYAFEPCPYAYSQLVRHTADLPHVHCRNQAVGASTGKVRLFRTANFHQQPDAASISSSLFSDKANIQSDQYVEVEQIDLVPFIKSLNRRIRILKIDIEGSEVPLLEHMLSTHTIDQVDVVFAETHEKRIPSLAQRTERLREVANRRFPGKLFLDWH